MKQHDLRLLGAACAGWVTVALGLAADVAVSVWWSAGLVALLLMLVAVTLDRGCLRGQWRSSTRFVGLSCAICSLVCVTTAGTLADQARGPVTVLAGERAAGSFELRIDGQVHKIAGADARPRYTLAATVEKVTARGRSARVNTPIVVLGDAEWKSLPWRGRIATTGRLAPSQRMGSARALLVVSGRPRIVEQPPAFLRGLDSVRNGLMAATGGLPHDAHGLVPALVVGDTSALPSELNEDMNTTGMSHLNAVSGSNVTIVMVAALWCLSRMGLRGRLRLLGGVAVILVYVLLCRPEPSVVRAGAMGVAGVVGTSWGRERAACPALGLSIVVLFVYDPWLAVSVGFALSALATLGLILFARPWAAAVVSRLPAWAPRASPKAVELCMIPLAAQFLCLPVLVALSGAVSWVSLPANVLAEPFVAPATLGGMVVTAVAAVLPALARWVAWLPGVPTLAIAGIAHLAANVPGNAVPWLPGTPGVVLAALCVMALLFLGRGIARFGVRGLVVGVAVASLPLSLTVGVKAERASPGAWVYAQCDVGQGDAELVRTGPSRAVLIDAGPEDGGIAGCLRRHRVTHLDAIVLTHFHADHVGGLDEALETAGPTDVYTTWVMEGARSVPGLRDKGEKGAGDHVDAVIRRRGVKAETLAPGQHLSEGGIEIDVLWPSRVIHEGSVQNNASLVLDLTSPSLHALVLGDAEREAQAACLAQVRDRAAQRPYDVVKVAHHGSSNQSSALYEAAHARDALIGVGAHNDYGHPAKKTLDLLERVQTQVHRTDREGDLDVLDEGHGLSVQPGR